MEKKNFLVSIIVPVYKGAETIGRLADVLVAEMSPRYNLEIVLVNDGSPDNSEAVCAEVYHKYPQTVKFYSLARNFSEHNAVMAGLNNCRGDFAVIMDDDFQNPVSEAIKLIDYAVANDFDVVYTYYSEKKHSFFRNLGSSFNGRIANLMLKKPKDLYLSSFKIVNRFLINEIIKYEGSAPYIDGLILRTTNHIGKIEVLHEKRATGRSSYTFKKLFSLWINSFISFSIMPLRIMTGAGFVFACLSFLLAIEIVSEKIFNFTDHLPRGYATLAVLILFFAGIQLIAIGICGEYVGRIFLFQNKRPQYVIRKKLE
ncbi:MAG: glycosyltransferase family 2 protein [Patescibacteria group bacterium]|nr:glycosyltransferase family 2 protein [Patescibacteria group bacterium]